MVLVRNSNLLEDNILPNIHRMNLGNILVEVDGKNVVRVALNGIYEDDVEEENVDPYDEEAACADPYDEEALYVDPYDEEA